MTDHDVLDAHLVRVAGDNAWQRRARLMQSLWRDRAGLAPGGATRCPRRRGG